MNYVVSRITYSFDPKYPVKESDKEIKNGAIIKVSIFLCSF